MGAASTSKLGRTPATLSVPRAVRVAELVALAGIYGALLTPLVYTRATIFPFVYPKALFFQAVVDLAFPAWAALALHDRRHRPRRSGLLWSMLVWVAAMTLATCLGDNPRRSLFSYPERMTGLWSELHVLAWFVMAAGALNTVQRRRWLLQVQLAVVFACAATAIGQWALPTVIGANTVVAGDRLAGLAGNPIYLGGLQAFGIFFAIILARQAGRAQRGLYLLATLAGAWAMLLAGSRGPMVGLVAGMLAMVILLARSGRYRRWAAAATAGLLALATGYGLLLGLLADRPSMEPFWAQHENLRHLFQFSIDPARLGLWRAAWDGFLRKPMLGWGPGGYELAFDAVFRPGWHPLGYQDKAHNVLLGVLCETGAIGAVAYLVLWGSFFVAAVRAARTGALTALASAALFGAGVAYFVYSLFAPDGTATDLASVVCFAAVAGAAAPGEHDVDTGERPREWRPARFVQLGLVSAGAVAALLFGSLSPFLASRCAREAIDGASDGDSAALVSRLAAAQRFPSPYVEDRLTAATGIAEGLAQADLLRTWPQREALIDLTLTATAAYLRGNPTHARSRTQLADALAAIGRGADRSELEGRAETLYRQSIAESPRRQSYRLAYAGFLTRVGRLQEAEREYRQALALEPGMGAARWSLGRFLWTVRKQADDGSRLMADAVETEAFDRYGPASPLEWLQLAQALARQKRSDRLRELVVPLRSLQGGPRAAAACVEIAKVLEAAGLLPERDQALRLAIERNDALAANLGRVLAAGARLRDP